MKRFPHGLSFLFILVLASASAKEPIQWKTGTVLHVQYKLDNSIGYNAGGPTQTAHGQFDFEADGTIYVAEEWVAPHVRLQISEGDTVELAVENKTLLLKMNEKKVRKMKLRHIHPEQQKQLLKP